MNPLHFTSSHISNAISPVYHDPTVHLTQSAQATLHNPPHTPFHRSFACPCPSFVAPPFIYRHPSQAHLGSHVLRSLYCPTHLVLNEPWFIATFRQFSLLSIPSYPVPFRCTPSHFDPFRPISTHSVPFRSTPTHPIPLRPISVHSNPSHPTPTLCSPLRLPLSSV